ncbi:MAG: ROK family protein [Methylophilaceae bacterium]
MAKSIGIDIGGTNFRIGVFDQLELLSETRFQADFSALCEHNHANIAWKTIVKTIAKGIEKALEEYADIQDIGIGFPGFIDPDTGHISESPNLPGLKNINLAQDLTHELNKKYQIHPVIVENDALAAAYGEYCMHKEIGASLIYFGLGTGVGGGLVLNGTPYAGTHGTAMEVGHLIVKPNGRLCGCGNKGCLEQYASANGIEKSYFLDTRQQFDTHKISELARNGEQAAIKAFQLAGEHLATAVAHTLKVVDVPVVVIGGGVSQAWDLIEDSFTAQLQTDLIPVLKDKTKIVISTVNDKAGMLGAAMLATNKPS